MEKVLTKLAKQLNAFDEASLMALWDKYAEAVTRFEPTKRWEEAALVLGFIQALRWKNQLFNYHWADKSRPNDDIPPTPLLDDPLLEEVFGGKKEPAKPSVLNKRSKVLRFRPREDDETV
ncbi:MAG: hypothetical protein D6E12_09580 [Desulfovibrio sp.]|nr:MAG: hypothetical protein D6E12_09580 [Desulfovibrio sp.]